MKLGIITTYFITSSLGSVIIILIRVRDSKRVLIGDNVRNGGAFMKALTLLFRLEIKENKVYIKKIDSKWIRRRSKQRKFKDSETIWKNQRIDPNSNPL